MTIDKIEKKEPITQTASTVDVFKSKRIVMRTVIFTVIIVLLSGLYLIYAWNRYNSQASSEAIALAQSLEVLLPHSHITELTGSSDDLEKPAYLMLKRNLMHLIEITNPIHFAYILAEQDGNILILLDSESPDSPDYSPPGQVFEEADDIYLKCFKSGETILTQPTTDRWGNWISVLVPIKDSITGTVFAVFGIDYSVSEWYAQLWKRMIPDIIVAICILILAFALFYARTQHAANKTLSKNLEYDEVLYRSVFDQAPIGIAIVNDKNFIYQSDFGHLNINPMFEEILGRNSHDLANIIWPEITHPDDLQADLEKFEQFKKGEIHGYSMEKRFIKPDGTSVCVNMIVSPLSGILDKNSMHLCLIDDISSRKGAEALLREFERRQTVLLSHLPGLAYRCSYDREWTMQYVSDGCFELTGYHPDSLINNRDLSYNSLITPEYREQLWNAWERTLSKRAHFRYEYEITTASGKRKWVLEMGQGIYNDEGEVEALEGIILDISDKKQSENNLKYINEHDRWTGLYNRDYLEKMLTRDARTQRMQKRALISINLSTVQLLTANYGFHYTQNLIKSAAETLGQYCNDKRTLFKTHENRFVFYYVDYKDKNELTEFCQGVADTLEALFVTDRIGGGIGILEIDRNNAQNVDLLLRRLLIASEKAINVLGKDFNICDYDGDLEGLVNREAEIRQQLSKIASDDQCGEFYLQYQPILDLRTDSICGFEALARLKTEKLGMVSPVEFIHIAEKTKFIIPIGKRIIHDAFRFINKLKENGYETISVSINISAIQLFRPDFTSSLFEMISEMHVNPKNISIEITESVFASDYDDINNIISKLRDAGLHIAIDDFGTGYSSLAREKELNVNCLKIDKYFMDKLLEDDPEKAITGDIISMAHKLGHCVIAEGVEQEEQKQYLLSHGCDMIQGYLIGRPLDEEAAIELLTKQARYDSGCHLNGSPY